VHPLAIDVMKELGIHIENQRSKPVDAVRDVPFDLVVTVCDAAAENCPVWLGRGRKVHLGFEDPAKASGTEDERRAEFRRVRDEMRQRLFDCLVNGR
jgi:arsenate reductase